MQPDEQKRAAEAAMRHLARLSAARNVVRQATTEELDELDELGASCVHCGGFHVRACPRVRRIEWHPNGVMAAVEFWPDDRINWEGVIFEDQGDGGAPEAVQSPGET